VHAGAAYANRSVRGIRERNFRPEQGGAGNRTLEGAAKSRCTAQCGHSLTTPRETIWLIRMIKAEDTRSIGATLNSPVRRRRYPTGTCFDIAIQTPMASARVIHTPHDGRADEIHFCDRTAAAWRYRLRSGHHVDRQNSTPPCENRSAGRTTVITRRSLLPHEPQVAPHLPKDRP